MNGAFTHPTAEPGWTGIGRGGLMVLCVGAKMELETELDQLSPTAAVLALRGRLITGPKLEGLDLQIKELIAAGMRKMLLDLTDLEYFDSAALALLVHVSGELASQDGELRIAAANERIRAVLKLTHTDRMLHLYNDLASSLSGFKA